MKISLRLKGLVLAIIVLCGNYVTAAGAAHALGNVAIAGAITGGEALLAAGGEATVSAAVVHGRKAVGEEFLWFLGMTRL